MYFQNKNNSKNMLTKNNNLVSIHTYLNKKTDEEGIKLLERLKASLGW